MFSCEFCEISKNTFFTEHLWATACVDNKLLIYFGEDKTKSILFLKVKGLKEINIYFVGHSIKQHDTVEYFGC